MSRRPSFRGVSTEEATFEGVLKGGLGFSRPSKGREKSFQAKEATCAKVSHTKMKGEESMWVGCGVNWEGAGAKCGDRSSPSPALLLNQEQSGDFKVPREENSHVGNGWGEVASAGLLSGSFRAMPQQRTRESL